MTFPLLSTIYTPHLPPICRASACCFTSSALSSVTQAMVSSLQPKDVSTSACRAMEKPWETPWKTDIFHRKTMENPWKTNKILKSPQFTLELRTHSIFLRQLWIAMNTRQWSVPRICGKWFGRVQWCDLLQLPVALVVAMWSRKAAFSARKHLFSECPQARNL